MLLVLIMLYGVGPRIQAVAMDEPSVVVLCGGIQGGLTSEESAMLMSAASKSLGQSGIVKSILVGSEKGCYPTLFEALEYSKSRKADYMVYMDFSKWGGYYSYHAELVEPMKGITIARFADKWKAEQTSTEKAMSALSSNVILASLGRITVNLTIMSTPPYCDVYRDEYRIGNTGNNGFRRTLYWERGSYEIRVCQPDYSDGVDILKVEENPTHYSRRFRLRKR
jgi:hypothetical protein